MSATPAPLLRPRLDTIPTALRELDQWVVWKGVWLPEKGKYSKVPYNARTGSKASSTDPATWSSFEQARCACEDKTAGYDGIGFVLHPDDPFAGVDLDHAVGEDKQLTGDALRFVGMLDSYTEVSPSGTGLRIFVIGDLPPDGRKKGDVEMYEEGRFLTLTGRTWPGTPDTIEQRQEALAAIHAEVFPPVAPRPQGIRTNPADLPADDNDLLKIAFKAKNGAKIEALYGGNTNGYPGASEADLALCSLLAFYTGDDPQRLDRMFRGSGLMRDKWDEPHYAGGETYGEHTVRKALDACTEFYSPPGSRVTASYKGATNLGLVSPDEPMPPYPPGGYNLTDLGNAERLVHRHGRDLRYNKAFGWLAFTGKVWQVDDSGEIYRRMKETVRYIHNEAADVYRQAAQIEGRKENLTREIAKLPSGEEAKSKALQAQVEAIGKESTKAAARAKELSAWAYKSEAAARIEAAISLAQKEAGIYAEPSGFDADPYLLNCQNGIVDLRTGALIPHDREAYCTRICATEYDLKARSPLWEDCLATWQPKEEVRLFLQRAAGYSLTGHTGEETAFLLYGMGRNGKSKFTGALEYIMGDYAGRAPIEIFMQSRGGPSNGPTPDKANLAGKRLIVASEIMQSGRFNEAFVKDVTGGDQITAAKKFRDPFTFKPTLKLWFYGNHKPQIAGTDDGIKARLPLIPFTETIPVEKRDPDLDAKLQAEAAGILAWAVQGCIEWQRQRLSPPKTIVRASEAYHEDQDILASFFKARCVFGGEETVWTPTADLRSALTEWAKGEGFEEKELPKPNDFADRLRREGCGDNNGKTKKHEGKPKRCWSNVRLKTDEDTEEEPTVSEENSGKGNTGNTGNAQTEVVPKQKNASPIGREPENSVTGVTTLPFTRKVPLAEWEAERDCVIDLSDDEELTDPFADEEPFFSVNEEEVS